MTTTHFITKELALRIALTYAGIENSEYHCLSNEYDDGFFRIAVWTPYLKYEFFVDAVSGDVAGIDMEPVPYPEALCFCSADEDGLTAARQNHL